MVASRLSKNTLWETCFVVLSKCSFKCTLPIALIRDICPRFTAVNVNFLFAYVNNEMSFPSKNLHPVSNLFRNYCLSFGAFFIKSTYMYVENQQIVVRCIICLIFVDDKLRHNLVKV